MPKIMDPILPIVSVLGYWAIIMGSFGGPGICSQITATMSGLLVPRIRLIAQRLHAATQGAHSPNQHACKYMYVHTYMDTCIEGDLYIYIYTCIYTPSYVYRYM